MVAFAAVILMQLPGFAGTAPAAEESIQMNQIRSALEKSSFTKEEKKRLLAAFDRASLAGIPAEDSEIIISRAMDRGAGAEHVALFLEAATGLREKDLPIRLVLDRIEQGLAKGVPTERISLSVRKLAGTVEKARPLVQGIKAGDAGAGESEKAIETVARALEKSITGEEISSTAEKVRNRENSLALFNRAVDTMTIFAGNGMGAADASRLVQRALDRGYSERDLEIMERYMVDGLRKKSSMSEIVSGMEARMERRITRGNSERGVGMRSPGQGNMGGGPMGGRR